MISLQASTPRLSCVPRAFSRARAIVLTSELGLERSNVRNPRTALRCGPTDILAGRGTLPLDKMARAISTGAEPSSPGDVGASSSR